MTRHREIPFLDIIEIKRDEIGAYAKINVILEDGRLVIRWGLDNFTFPYIKDAFSARCFDIMPGVAYKHRLLIQYAVKNNDGVKEFYTYIECIQNKKRKDVEFRCSEYFASNLQWFSKIKNIHELSSIEWKDV
ncbi:hypothetical protein [Candidatus Clostridium radicumherbarum]|uniref:Uncharacterized protein n=1 Tax=Candidatus Clostridium radicumherbarum TaxID=3381662 RepID=A0ABW8TUK3_9CLOT